MKSNTALFSPSRLVAAALLAAIAGSVATLAQAQPQAGSMMMAGHRDHGGHGMMGGPGGGRGGMGMQMSEQALDHVGASDDQKKRVRDIMKAAHDDMRAQRQAGQATREQAMAVFSQPVVDARAAEAVRQQMLQQHDQASRRMMQAMLDASAVLTPEQRGKLADTMKQRRAMAERHQRERQHLDGAPRRP
ncbi:MAG: Spy/CpxP family protein refolding chaperone [Aquabacterium sp.]